MFSAITKSQRALSDALDAWLPDHFRIDGHRDYRTNFVPRYLRPRIEVWDVGGGNCPLLDAATKKALKIHYVGLDISPEQLESAGPGVYDEKFAADITRFTGRSSADLVICQAVLEHVPDTFSALASIYSILKPGGIAAIFVPAKNAVSARLNLLIPEKVKRKLLAMFWPELEGRQGSRALYHRCTAPACRCMAREHGYELIEECLFHQSGYFRI
jgi:SAM-dependent methyltransferase